MRRSGGLRKSGKVPVEYHLHLLRRPRHRRPELLRSDAGRYAHIDRLAAQGQRFTNAYATSATSTPPSRFGLLTRACIHGVSQYADRAPGNSEDSSSTRVPLRSPTPCTMPELCHGRPVANGIWGWVPSAARISNVEIRPDARDIRFRLRIPHPGHGRPRACVFVENGRVVGAADPLRSDHGEL